MTSALLTLPLIIVLAITASRSAPSYKFFAWEVLGAMAAVAG
jgi:hypothetical protein